MNGSCVELRDRIVESFIGVISDLMVSRNLCQPRHRCRIRNTFIYCAATTPRAPDAAAENLTVEFVLETELRPDSGPATLSDQKEIVYSLDDVFAALFQLVRDGELTWSTRDHQIVATLLDSALVQFDMDNCSAGQILNDRNSDAPTCRKCGCWTFRTPNLLVTRRSVPDVSEHRRRSDWNSGRTHGRTYYESRAVVAKTHFYIVMQVIWCLKFCNMTKSPTPNSGGDLSPSSPRDLRPCF